MQFGHPRVDIHLFRLSCFVANGFQLFGGLIRGLEIGESVLQLDGKAVEHVFVDTLFLGNPPLIKLDKRQRLLVEVPANNGFLALESVQVAENTFDLAADARFENAPWAIPELESILALTEIMAELFRQQPRAYWLQLLSEADVPCAPVNRREEFMEDAQLLHNRMMVDIDDPTLGATRQMGVAMTLTDNHGAIKGPAPRLGEHTSEVLDTLGYSADAIRHLAAEGAV